jgi:hypothetical protein
MMDGVSPGKKGAKAHLFGRRGMNGEFDAEGGHYEQDKSLKIFLTVGLTFVLAVSVGLALTTTGTVTKKSGRRTSAQRIPEGEKLCIAQIAGRSCWGAQNSASNAAWLCPRPNPK